MKFPFLLMAVALAATVHAQEADPLTVTLPNGRVLHFHDAEQKAKFEAARQRQQQQQHPSAAILAQTPRQLPPSSLDVPSTRAATSSTAAQVPRVPAARFTSSLDATPAEHRATIKGRILRVHPRTREISMEATGSRVVGMESVDGTVGLKGVPNFDKLSEGDLLDVIGVQNGFHDYIGSTSSTPNTRVRSYDFVSGRFYTASGTPIK